MFFFYDTAGCLPLPWCMNINLGKHLRKGSGTDAVDRADKLMQKENFKKAHSCLFQDWDDRIEIRLPQRTGNHQLLTQIADWENISYTTLSFRSFKVPKELLTNRSIKRGFSINSAK